MGIIPTPSSRQMKNNTFSIQYSDDIITKSILRAQEGKKLLVAWNYWSIFKLVKGLKLSMASLMWLLWWVLLVQFFWKFGAEGLNCLSFISIIACQELGYI